MSGTVIGLVGCGQWGTNILRDLLELGCAVAVADPDVAARTAATDAGARVVVDDVARLPDVQGIVIASSTRSHGAALDATLAHGVPIFVEKPIFTDPAAIEALVHTAADRVFEMHKWRYHPGVETLAAIARSGELGRVRSLHTVRLGWVDSHHDVDPVWVLAPHDLSIAIEILGALPEPAAARSSEIDAVPVALLGILGLAPWLSVEISGRSSVRRREVRLVCEGGSAMFREGSVTDVVVSRVSTSGREEGREELEERPIDPELPLFRELRSFVDHVRGAGPPPRSSLRDSLAVARTIVALRALAGVRS